MTLASRLRAGESAVGYWTSLTDPAVAELAADTGFDFVVVDTEHTPTSLESVADLVRAVEAAPGDAVPFVRVPWNDPVRIKRTLDLDPAGLLAPMVSTAGEARAFVEATRYPPEGRRGVGVGRAARYGRDVAGQLDRDDDLVTVAQIETAAGVENAPDIAATDGLDALFVGPADLSTALGGFGEYDGEFRDAVDRVLAAGDDAGAPVGTLATSPEEVRRWHDWGFDWIVAGVDVVDLCSGATGALEAAGDVGWSE